MSESLSKPVQELVVDGDKLPEKYINRKEENGATDASVLPLIEVPVIDLSLLTSPSPAGEDELRKLRSALVSCGYFQAINHGMGSSFLEKVHEIGKKFFSLPMEEKHKYSRTVGDIEGYGNDPVLSEHQILKWSDRLYLTVSPQHKIKLGFWPQNPENFREILSEYTRNIGMINELLLKSMAKSLKIEENSFLKQHGDEGAKMTARYNLYPPCPRPDLSFGIPPHGDASTISFVLQDNEVEGLQILDDGQWFRVSTFPHAILVILGDRAEIMSNGIFKSPMHRVVTNAKRERLTLVVFSFPEAKLEIGPVEELIDDEKRPRLYEKMKDYISIYLQHFDSDKRPIDVVKIR